MGLVIDPKAEMEVRRGSGEDAQKGGDKMSLG